MGGRGKKQGNRPQNLDQGGRGGQNQGGSGRGGQNQGGSGRGGQQQGGSGRGKAPSSDFVPAPTPAQSAWGRPAPTHVPAPAPTQSAWGNPAHVPAPIPAQSAWGNPGQKSNNVAGPAPSSQERQQQAPSAWGNPGQKSSSGAEASSQQQRQQAPSAWGNPGQRPSSGAEASSQQQRQQAPSAWGNPGQWASSGAGSSSSSSSSSSQQQQQQAKPAWGNPRQGPSNGAGSSSTSSQPSNTCGRVNGGNSRGAQNVDRGAVRGKAIIMKDPVRTRSESKNVPTKQGTAGYKCKLQTNFYRVLKRPNWNIYQYRVDFSPPTEHERFKAKLIAEQEKHLGTYVFDGTMLFLLIHLPKEVTEFMSKDREGNPIQTTVKFTNVLSMTSGASLQILNLIFRRSMNALNLTLAGRNYFDSVAKIDFRYARENIQLELWPGYVTSIRQHEKDILLCVESITKAMRPETIYKIMKGYYDRQTSNWTDLFADAVLGTIVQATYTARPKTYRIDDIDYRKSPLSTFNMKGEDITYVEYYKRKYQVVINDHAQPLLISRTKARDQRGGEEEDTIALIPELCLATGLTQEMRANRGMMIELAKITRLDPKTRIDRLHAFNERLQTTEASVNNLRKWNFKLDTQLVEVDGRELPREKILLGKGQSVQADQKGDWSKSFHKTSMYTQCDLKNWIVIVPKTKCAEAQRFIGILQKAGNGMHYVISQPKYIQIPDDRTGSYAKNLDDAARQNPQLIMCFVSNDNADRYAVIKKKCYVEWGIPSQVMKMFTIGSTKPDSALMSVATKVTIQLNAKLGGAPWMVDTVSNRTMIVGFDVCHDTKDKNESYGALVASMDMRVAQHYYSAVSAHKDGQELCNYFVLNFSKALRCYSTQHKYLPERIIMYRDGVGDGQLSFVMDHEVKAILNYLKSLKGGDQIKLTFIVVTKRINARFFLASGNPKPGTVVDDIVTLPERNDFYMISQYVGIGTVSPTSYHILYDSSKWSPDTLQSLTYKLTHLYYNWAGTLAVPAVCQYAHRLAFLAGTYLHAAPEAKLDKKLYFL